MAAATGTAARTHTRERRVSRRHAMGVGLAAASILSGGCRTRPQRREASTALEEGAIDGHVHVWTADTERYPLDPAFTKEDMKPPSFEPEELFTYTKPLGIARVVLIQMSYYGYDNRYMTDVLEKYPGVFSAVGVIDEEAAPRPTMLALKKDGVRGFRIQPRGRPAESWLDGDGMKKMWACGADEGLAMCPLIRPQFLPAVERMCRDFPHTPVVIDHVGLVGATGTFLEEELQALCALAPHPHVAVKLSAFYALGRKQPPYRDLASPIRRLVGAFGPERLLWASDGPYQMLNEGHNCRDSIELVRSGLDFLSADDRAWILRKTAERLFFS